MTSYGNDTFCCTSDEIDEGKCQYIFKIAVECFYESAIQVLTENRELCLKKIDRGEEMTLHAGAALALEKAIENIRLIKEHMLDTPQND